MKHNVLVFPCGSEIGLEAYRSICYSTYFNVFGGSSVADHGQYVFKNYIANLPFVNDDDFVAKLNEIVSHYNIEFIIPAHDDVVLKLAEAKASGELKCEVVTSPLETCQISRSKAKTYDKLKAVITTPKVYKDNNEIQSHDLPVFLKPDVGQGSKGTVLAKTKEEVSFYLAQDPSCMILENLPGVEYTIDCFTDKSGRLLFSEARKRIRIMNGISVSSETVEGSNFRQIAETINQQLKFRGVWFFQLKLNSSGQPALLEVAPRIAGTMGLVRAKGVNLVLMSLFDLMNVPVEIQENDYKIVIDRALSNSFKHNLEYTHVYLDFDDTVVLNDKINPLVLAFVIQCINKGIKVHLITRHANDIDETLKRYRLTNIFDDVKVIKEDEHKTDFITEPKAIFIDDSFAERKKVHQINKIPVFDAHMLEALID